MITTTPLRPGSYIDTAAGPVIVRVQRTDAGQTWALSVRYPGGFLVDDLRRTYTDERAAIDAFAGMIRLFRDGYTVDAVIAFGRQMAPAPDPEPTYTCAAEAGAAA